VLIAVPPLCRAAVLRWLALSLYCPVRQLSADWQAGQVPRLENLDLVDRNAVVMGLLEARSGPRTGNFNGDAAPPIDKLVAIVVDPGLISSQ